MPAVFRAGFVAELAIVSRLTGRTVSVGHVALVVFTVIWAALSTVQPVVSFITGQAIARLAFARFIGAFLRTWYRTVGAKEVVAGKTQARGLVAPAVLADVWAFVRAQATEVAVCAATRAETTVYITYLVQAVSPARFRATGFEIARFTRDTMPSHLIALLVSTASRAQ